MNDMKKAIKENIIQKIKVYRAIDITEEKCKRL